METEELPAEIKDAIAFHYDGEVAPVVHYGAKSRCPSAGEVWQSRPRTPAAYRWRKIHTKSYWAWISVYIPAMQTIIDQADRPESIAAAQAIIDGGYQQRSRRYREFARVPPGLDPIEAIRIARPEAYERLRRMAEREFVVWTEDPANTATLSVAEYIAYRRLLNQRTAWEP